MAGRSAGRRRCRYGTALVTREDLATAPALAALARLALLALALMVGMSYMRARMTAESPRGRRLNRRRPRHAHFRRAGAGVVVFHFCSFRRRANRKGRSRHLDLFQVGDRLAA